MSSSSHMILSYLPRERWRLCGLGPKSEQQTIYYYYYYYFNYLFKTKDNLRMVAEMMIPKRTKDKSWKSNCFKKQ